MSAKIVGFINQKGGVGKSFASKIVANALSGGKYKKRILLIDCDEQDTIAGMRKKDIAIMKSKGKNPEFAYEIAQCRAELLTNVIAGKKPMQIITSGEPQTTTLNLDNYDCILIDMPGRGQGNEIYALLSSLDYAVIVVKSGDSETLSTLDFLQTIDHSQKLRTKYNMDALHLALMYNEFENTATDQNAVRFWEKMKPKYNIYREIFYLSRKETYRKYDNTYTNPLYELKNNKTFANLYEEMNNFISGIIKFIKEQ